jgi:hypothetical protein
LDSTLQKYNNDYLFTTNVYSNALLAWWKFIKDEFNLETFVGAELDSWNDLYMKSGVYSAIFSETLCIVSKYPKKIHRDTEGRLHNPSGQAVEWSYTNKETAFDCYYIHGRNINKDIFEKALSGKLTKEEYLSEINDETRSAWYEILGEEKMLLLLEAELIDETSIVHKNGEIEKIGFYRTKQKLNKIKNEQYAWRKVICPSTKTTYFTPTNPNLKTAIDVAKFHRPEWVPNEIDYKWHSRS